MKTNYFLPHFFKPIGWLLFVPGLIIGLLGLTINEQLLGWHMPVLSLFDEGLDSPLVSIRFITKEITFTLAGSLLIVGSLLIAFSKLKDEDEYIGRLRLASFQWAVFANYGLLLLIFLTVYGITFLTVLPYTIFTVILFFIARFHYLLYKNRKYLIYEE